MEMIRDNVLVKPCASDAISEGGIFIPESVQTRSNRGVIVSVGNGTKKEPMKLKEGMTVFNIFDCGEEIIIDGEKHYMMKQHDILAQLQN